MNSRRKIVTITVLSLLLAVNVYAASVKLWSAPATVTIVASLNPDFTLTVHPPTQELSQGESINHTITLTSLDNFAQPVQLSVTGTPSGVTTNLNPGQVTPQPNKSVNSTLTISANETATLGSHQLTLTGTNGTLTHDIQIPIGIIPIPEFPSFLILAVFMMTTALAVVIYRKKRIDIQ